jgi:hypothetical protein
LAKSSECQGDKVCKCISIEKSKKLAQDMRTIREFKEWNCWISKRSSEKDFESIEKIMHKVNHNNGKIIGGYAKSNIPFVSQKMH